MHVLYSKVLIHIQCSNLYGQTCPKWVDLDSTLVCIRIVVCSLVPWLHGSGHGQAIASPSYLTSKMMKWDIFRLVSQLLLL